MHEYFSKFSPILFFLSLAFPDFTYKWCLCVSVSVWVCDFIRYKAPRVCHCCHKQQDVLLSRGWTILLCKHAPHLLYLIVWWWTLRLSAYLGCCDAAALNTAVHGSPLNPVSITFEQTIRSGTAELLVALCLVFWGPPIQFSIVVAPVYIPTSSARGFPFLHILTNTFCLCCLDSSRPEAGEVSLVVLRFCDAEYLAMALSAVWTSSLEKHQLSSPAL